MSVCVPLNIDTRIHTICKGEKERVIKEGREERGAAWITCT